MNIDPNFYRKYAVVEKLVNILYRRIIKKCIYISTQGHTILFKLITDLKNCFIVNPYKLCVENKLFNGKMMKAVWHVDDLKVAYGNEFEVTKFAQYLSTIYK